MLVYCLLCFWQDQEEKIRREYQLLSWLDIYGIIKTKINMLHISVSNFVANFGFQIQSHFCIVLNFNVAFA